LVNSRSEFLIEVLPVWLLIRVSRKLEFVVLETLIEGRLLAARESPSLVED